MLPVFHDVLQDGIKKFLASSDPATNKPRFFALAADKVTELRRTGQLVGKWSLPDILLADPPVVEGHDKVGITDNIHTNVLQNQYKFASEELKQQLTGGGFDGQYSKLGVHKELAERLGNSLSWLMLTWDGGHKTELVLGDTRQDEALVWYKELSDFTGEISSKI
eukprot:gene7402-8814_t